MPEYIDIPPFREGVSDYVSDHNAILQSLARVKLRLESLERLLLTHDHGSLNPHPTPAITGSTAGSAPLAALLAALDQLGLVSNQTTN